ncbi:AMP-binding protein [Nesterenkonia haasae]|uniref:AMP-binding protein n=1 Tax=Nesterenkonia haasae TaxID=2587813 RepID=UPI00139207E5|nr:AMP-binding protein [Nesterenkonia haasae]
MYENHANIWEAVAQRRPHWTALIAGEKRYDFDSFDREAKCFAASLQGAGVRSGDRVAFYLHNTAEFFIAFYACLKIEAVAVSLNYRYQANEIVELVEVSRPKALIYRVSSKDAVRHVQQQLAGGEATPELWIEVDDGDYAEIPEAPGPEGARTFEAMASVEYELTAPRPEGHAEMYMFTGGTTGRPKAVVWALGDLLKIQRTSTYAPLKIRPPDSFEEAARIACDEATPQVTTLPLAPFMHATALFMSMNTLNVGGTVVISPYPSLNTSAAADLAISNNVTQLIVAGDAVALPMVEALESHARRDKLQINSIMSSGMRLSDETKERIHRLGEVRIMDILASSEGGPFAMGISTNAAALPAHFKLTPEAVVLDEQNREVQETPGAKGLLAYRGALPKGYLNEPEKTKETYPVINGVRYVRPGDYVEVQAGGYIEFLGRGSAVVNTGGEKVYPAEVEEALLEVDGVNDAVVFGLPDQRLGERVSAIVAVDDGATVTAEKLQEWLGQKLAGFKKPRTIVIRSSLDRTPAGKLDMRKVRQTATQAASEIKGETAL